MVVFEDITVEGDKDRGRVTEARVFWNSITARDEVSARERFIKRDIFSCISVCALARSPSRDVGGIPRAFVAELPVSPSPRWIRAERGNL